MNEIMHPLGFSFQEPDRAFYAVSESWKGKGPHKITEDMAYVIDQGRKTSNYRPITAEIFMSALRNMANKGAIQIKPSELKEAIDYDPSDFSEGDITFLLFKDVLFRIRKDNAGKDNPNIHTMMMIGLEKQVIDVAQELVLPHPFDSSLYPYKKDFIAPPDYVIKVLR